MQVLPFLNSVSETLPPPPLPGRAAVAAEEAAAAEGPGGLRLGGNGRCPSARARGVDGDVGVPAAAGNTATATTGAGTSCSVLCN